MKVRLWGFRRRSPSPNKSCLENLLSQPWTPLQSVTHQSRKFKASFELTPSEVSSPTAFSQSQGATIPTSPTSFGLVTSSGFHILSTLCSPCDLLGLFHPSPALGVHPSRLYSPRCSHTLSRTSQPSWSLFELPQTLLQGLAPHLGSVRRFGY